MTTESKLRATILVVEDIHEIRDGFETLLKTDGYSVTLARDERDAIESAQRTCPDLILLGLAGSSEELALSARRIREQAVVGQRLPVVVFCIEGIAEGDEVEIGENVHLTCPDNFNQLRGLIARLLSQKLIAG